MKQDLESLFNTLNLPKVDNEETIEAKRKFAILTNSELIITDLRDIHYTPFWDSQDLFRGS